MNYEIKWIRKKGNKNMYLRVKEGVVIVTTPTFTSKTQVMDFIESKQDWIEKHLHTKPLLLQEGLVTQFIGKKVKVHIGENCKLKNNDLTLSSDIQKSKKFLLVMMELFVRDRFLYWCEQMGYENIDLQFGFYKSKWGSCQPKKRLVRLNAYLLFTDMEIIDSIIVHEMAHMKEMNHSSAFYDEVFKYKPDYKIHDKRLKKLNIPRLVE